MNKYKMQSKRIADHASSPLTAKNNIRKLKTTSCMLVSKVEGYSLRLNSRVVPTLTVQHPLSPIG